MIAPPDIKLLMVTVICCPAVVKLSAEKDIKFVALVGVIPIIVDLVMMLALPLFRSHLAFPGCALTVA